MAAKVAHETTRLFSCTLFYTSKLALAGFVARERDTVIAGKKIIGRRKEIKVSLRICAVNRSFL